MEGDDGFTEFLGNLPGVHRCKGQIVRIQLGCSVDVRGLVGEDNVTKAIPSSVLFTVGHPGLGTVPGIH